MSYPNDYRQNDPRGWNGDPSRGAAMGRKDRHAEEPYGWHGRLYVSRVLLDSEGYDPNGTYYGQGAPLFWVRNVTYEIDFTLRASHRDLAVLEAKRRYPRAVFARGVRT